MIIKENLAFDIGDQVKWGIHTGLIIEVRIIRSLWRINRVKYLVTTNSGAYEMEESDLTRYIYK